MNGTAVDCLSFSSCSLVLLSIKLGCIVALLYYTCIYIHTYIYIYIYIGIAMNYYGYYYDYYDYHYDC